MNLKMKTLLSLSMLLLGAVASGVSAQQRAIRILPTNRVEVTYPKTVDVSALPDFKPNANTTRRHLPFRPTIPIDVYNNLKQRNHFEGGGDTSDPFSGISPLGATRVKMFEGLNSNDSGGWMPSDCNGAISPTNYIEITNSALGIYTRGGTRTKLVDLATFFNYNKQPLFDPQVKYDATWNRWIVTATAFPEDKDHMYLFFWVSKTNNPNGEYYGYVMNVAFNSDDFWDFQKVGLTQDAVLFDANVFNGNNFSGASLFSFAKARVYNGLGVGSPLFQKLNGTLTLPLVQDQSATAYLIYDRSGTSTVGTYALTNASHPSDMTLTLGPSVNVGVAQTVARPANQPGTNATLDTIDTRFPNNSVQVGSVVYATNCISVRTRPTVNLIAINAAAGTKVMQVSLKATGSSDDFNPQLSVNSRGDIAVAWSSTMWSSTAGFPAIYINGMLNGGSFGTPTRIAFSKVAYVNDRWGDYSSLNVDPVDGIGFWGVNQYNTNPELWGTKIYNITVN